MYFQCIHTLMGAKNLENVTSIDCNPVQKFLSPFYKCRCMRGIQNRSLEGMHKQVISSDDLTLHLQDARWEFHDDWIVLF